MSLDVLTPTPGVAARTGRYLYAVIDSGREEHLGLTGLDGAPVYSLSDGRVAAVVSDVPDSRIRPERRRLAAHHEVLKTLVKNHALLPMSFGVIADGPDAVRKILSLNQAAFVEGLARVAGRMEMGLRVVWDVPNIFEYILATHPELRALRDHIFRSGREPSQEEKIELGRQFDRLRATQRAAKVELVEGVLRSCCHAIKENKIRNDNEIMNLACLIDKDAQKDFEQAVIAAANLFDNNYAFDFNGPWPPHNFAEMNLQLEGDDVSD